MRIKSGKLIIPLLCILGSGVGLFSGTYAVFSTNTMSNVSVSGGALQIGVTDYKIYDASKLVDNGGNLETSTIDITSEGVDYVALGGGSATLNETCITFNSIAPGDEVVFKYTFENQSSVNMKYHLAYYETSNYIANDIITVKYANQDTKPDSSGWESASSIKGANEYPYSSVVNKGDDLINPTYYIKITVGDDAPISGEYKLYVFLDITYGNA